MGIEGPGQLHPRRTDGARRAIDKDLAPRPEIRSAQVAQRHQRPVADRRRLLIGHAARFARERRVLAHTHVLGVRPKSPRVDAEDRVADREGGDGRRDLAGHLGAEDPEDWPPHRPEEAARRDVRVASAGDQVLAAANRAVGSVDRGGVDPDEDLIVAGTGTATSSSRSTSGGPYLS